MSGTNISEVSCESENSEPPKKLQKFVNDIVHGMIDLPDYIVEIIDTPQFQRLRSIRQLGFSSFVYPTASNTRFEHSIGTFHLASLLINQLRKRVEEDKLKLINGEELISDDDVKCVEIAALCHDLGHGPFSHVWESCVGMILKDSGCHKSHEKLSCEIFKLLINTTKSGEDIAIKEKLELNDTMIDLICRLILGQYDTTKDNDRRFLFEIIANKKSGLDVDKFDYLCRDTIHLGWSNTDKIRDIKRIIHFLRVIKHEREYRLATRDREIFHIHDIYYSRHLLHRYGYQHKTTKAIECMFRNALENIMINQDQLNYLINLVIEESAIETILNNIDSDTRNKMKEKRLNENILILFSPEFISQVCDYHIWDAMKRHDKDFMKIHERKIYKLHSKLQILENNDKEKDSNLNKYICELENEINKYLLQMEEPKKFQVEGTKKFVLLSLTKFCLGSEKSDPISEMLFYKKGNAKEILKFALPNSEGNPNATPPIVKRPLGLVQLIDSENILLVFVHPDKEQEIKNKLNNIKNALCAGNENVNEFNVELKKEIEDICKKYNFAESSL